jgi:hypothetical protein
MTGPRPYLPSTLMEIAEIAGLDAALKVGTIYSSKRLYVPRRIGARHELAELVGLDAARKMVARYGGDTLVIPPALAGQARTRREAIHRMTGEASQTEIAHALGIARSTVQRQQAKARGKAQARRGGKGQGDLFG